MKSSILLIVGFIVVIWAVEIFNGFSGGFLREYGILPRTFRGLIGVPLSPFLHGNTSHVLSNTLPFAILGGFVAIQGRQVLVGTSLFIIILGGLGVWLFGRPDLHIGASGLIFGYFGYLVARGWYERSFASILIAIVVVFLYGGLIFGILPIPGFVSWEAHLFGLVAGVLAARLMRPERQDESE